MKTVEWQVKEDFVFPTSAGVPTGAETIRVTPRYTTARTAEAVRLTGIYHIAANISLDLEKSREELVEKATLIDDVDVQGETGYFEYAVPFHIDLPAEVKDPLKVVTTTAACEMDGQGTFAVVWDVECSYRQEEVAKEQGGAAKEEATISAEAAQNTQKEAVAVDSQVEVKNKSAKKREPNEGAAKATVEKEEMKLDTASAKVESEVAETVQSSEPKVESAVAVNEEKEQAAESKIEQVVENAVAVEETNEEMAAAAFIVEDTTFSDSDEALAFIAGLDDGISSTLFRSNDVSMQAKS